jgi:BirA family biotin operon repressor/biotin-[acetyl-CoA-carboxylase] ligase
MTDSPLIDFRSDYPFAQITLPNGTMLLKYVRVASTMVEATRYLDHLSSHKTSLPNQGLAFVSTTQTKGQGRYPQRKWISEKGGLYYTLLIPSLNFDTETENEIAKRSIGVGNLVRHLIYQQTNLAPSMKRPNDLLYQNKKLGGILIKNTKHQNQSVAIIGIGLNINQKSFSNELSLFATSLYQHLGKATPIAPLITNLTTQLISCFSSNKWNLASPEFD